MTFFVQNISFFPSHVKLAHPVGNSMKFIIFKSIYHIFGPLLTKLLSKESLVPDVLFTSFEYVIIKCFWRCCVCKHFFKSSITKWIQNYLFCHLWHMQLLRNGHIAIRCFPGLPCTWCTKSTHTFLLVYYISHPFVAQKQQIMDIVGNSGICSVTAQLVSF